MDQVLQTMRILVEDALPFKVDLELLAKLFPKDGKLNPKYPRYRRAYVKLDGIKGIVIVFSSGAMISVGSKSVEDAQRDLTVAYNVILNGMKHLRERASIRIGTEKVKSQRP